MPAPVVPAAAGPLLALGWLGGTAAQLQQPALWDTEPIVALALGGLLAALAAWHWRRHGPAALLLALAAAALGFAATSGRAAWRLADALDPALEGRDLVVTGVVAELPRIDAIGTRFVFEVEAASDAGAPVQVPRRISLGWYRGWDDGALLDGPLPDLRAGQRWRLTVRLRQPHGAFNPHGFDLELWLFEQGIRAGGTVRTVAGAETRKLADDAGHPVERLRQDLRDAVVLHVDDARAAGVLAALAVGDQAAIDREGWDLFRIVGVAHLMSISGLHVTMFAWMVGGLAARLWRRWPRAALACPAPLAARWLGLAAAAAYALLAGWGVPAQRTVGMIAVVVVLRSLGLRWPLWRVLLAVALAVALGDPWALLQPGFWLSFVAVALLVAAEPARGAAVAVEGATGGQRWVALVRGQRVLAPESGQRLLAPKSAQRLLALESGQRLLALVRGGLHTQAVATVGLTPLTLLFFQQVSVVGFVANLVAIPLVTLLITPLALLGLLWPPLWTLAAALVQGLTALLSALAAWPLAVWHAAAAPPWAVAAGLLAALLAVLPLPWRLRVLALPLLLPMLAPPVQRPPEGRFELVVADVGQGTAVLVRTRHHLLLYDAGPVYTPEADAAGRVLLPLLRGRGERRIDRLVLSHQDIDHVGGAPTLLAAFPVAAITSSLPEGHALRGAGVPHQTCAAGQSWDWDGVRFEMLHPPADRSRVAAKPNALSCVLRIQGRAGSALLPGDIEAAQESDLVARAADRLRAEMLLVPHHGSRSSSSAAWIDAVQPQVAVVQAAYRSHFGHPAPEVEARYRARGIRFVRSDACGAWTWSAGGVPSCHRLVARRYWHHPGAVAATTTP